MDDDLDFIMGADISDRERLAKAAAQDWYSVTINGTNPAGETDTADVRMSGDIEFTVRCWANDKGWTDCTISSIEKTSYYSH